MYNKKKMQVKKSKTTTAVIFLDIYFLLKSTSSENEQQSEFKKSARTRGIGLAVRMPKHLVVSSGGYSFLRRKLSSSGRGVVKIIPITYR